MNVISGEVNPSGRLPMTFPKCIEDVPAAENFPANENLDIHYAEGGHVGYRALRGEKPSPRLSLFLVTDCRMRSLSTLASVCSERSVMSSLSRTFLRER